MRSLFTKNSLTIRPGEAVSGTAGRIRTLRVLQGRVWITVEGIPHDYWLSAGDTFTTIPGRLTVVEADRLESRIELHASGRWLNTLKMLAAAMTSRLAARGTVTASFKRHGTCNGNC